MPQSPLLALTAPTATVDLADWTIAAHYGDVAAEVLMTCSSAGLIDRSERGRVFLRGPDRGEWLNRIVSNDTSRLQAGEGLRALLLTPKGRIACDVRVHALDDRFLLDTAFDTAAGLLAVLSRYRMYGDEVEVEDVRDGTVQIGVRGPDAAARVTAVTGLDTSSLAPRATLEADGVVAIGADDMGLPGCDLVVPAERGERLWRELAAATQPFGWQAAEVLRLEAALPRWGAELREDYLPLEAELEEALSHTKGCYPGQEVVARMRDRGHANRLLRALTVAGDKIPVRGAAITVAGAAKAVGHVTSAVQSPRLGVLALGYVRREQAQPETTVTVEVEGGLAGAVVGKWGERHG